MTPASNQAAVFNIIFILEGQPAIVSHFIFVRRLNIGHATQCGCFFEKKGNLDVSIPAGRLQPMERSCHTRHINGYLKFCRLI